MPGLPKNLSGTYQKYKNHTDAIAQWLATTAKSRGYVSPEAKNTSKAGKGQGRPTYTLPTKEWTAHAEFLVGLADPIVSVPEKLAALLDATIGLRQLYSNTVAAILDDTDTKKDSDDRHAFFLNVLKNVRSILSPLLPKRPEAQSTPKTIDEVMNIFTHLELQEPSEAFKQAPDVTPANAPIYKAERPNDMEEAYFALHLLLRDFAKLRTEVSHAWAGYKNGGHDIVAASITTNVAVDLARSMIEELKNMFAPYGGILKMYQIFYASQCVPAGISEKTSPKELKRILDQRERPGDEMNFAMYKVASDVMWPAHLLLDAWCEMHKVNPHPEMKRGFYGTYNPASNREQKSNREKFREDKILLLENLPEFYFYCRTTKPNPPPVEDEFIRLLRTMFETKQVTLPLVFATTLFLDIHNMLRSQVDNGFKRLTDAMHYVVGDIKEEFEFHADIKMDTWPKQNDDVMQHFIETIEFWVHKDHQRENAPKIGRIFTPEPFHLFRKHPWWCGLWKYWALMQFHEFGIAFVNAWGSVMSCTHLYNAVGGGGRKDLMWKDLDVVIGLQDPKTFFIGEAPTTPDDCLKRFALAMGASAASLAKSTRKKKGLTLSKKGPKGLKELGAVLQTFRARICEANGPKQIRAEDVQKILEHSNWEYELDEKDNAQQIYKDVGEKPSPAPKKQLSVNKCLGLIRDLLHAEMMEISFDYFRLHRQCWRLLRVIKDSCRDDLIRIYGPDYIERESQLPFIVGYVLMSASSAQQLGELLVPKQPDVQVTSKVLENAKDRVQVMIDTGSGALIVDHILPCALDLQIGFEFEAEG
ncbi:hypothetical protein P171DRAFT_453049 [Karstenula rhodostoma CBS 690.94]|uniref:DUF6604 domain-containing protein n=1 Tax=Karstenula rhodostoma CBS 690.94 TaxID=1392251 RepID=A0A9P4UG48_9PLEO|nr:hypothetical protein P171DRAFT_453049 [Karstenula rhodostoma CBS 690.94]